MADSSQAHGCDAAALFAIGIASKLAGSDSSGEIGRDRFGRPREDAFSWILRRRSNFLNNRFLHIQDWIARSQPQQLGDYRSPLRRSEYLHVSGAALRSEQAEPHFHNLWPAAPETEEIFEVARPLDDLRRDGAVNGHPRSADVLEDALVGGWLAAFVVLRLQAVDRYHDIQLLEPAPVGWNNSEGAGHDLRMYSAAFQLRQEQFKLTISNQRIPAYKRDMKRLAFIDERKHSVDQFIALEVGKLTQLNSTSKMCRVERIAARTSEGAFLGDFNRERR